MKSIIIIGAGGLGREIEWLINRINKGNQEWNILGFADDNISKGTKCGKSEVICTIDELKNYNNKVYVVIAIGNSIAKSKIYEKLENNKNIEFPNIIDPNAIVGDVQMGIGNIICAGVIATVNIKLGNFILINLDCTVGHDVVIKDFVTIYPSVNVSGNIIIGENTEIGTGTQIIQQKNIANNVIIGAGTVVVKKIEEEGTYVGAPAQKIK